MAGWRPIFRALNYTILYHTLATLTHLDRGLDQSPSYGQSQIQMISSLVAQCQAVWFAVRAAVQDQTVIPCRCKQLLDACHQQARMVHQSQHLKAWQHANGKLRLIWTQGRNVTRVSLLSHPAFFYFSLRSECLTVESVIVHVSESTDGRPKSRSRLSTFDVSVSLEDVERRGTGLKEWTRPCLSNQLKG